MKREGVIDHECIKLAEYFLDGLKIDHADNVLRVAIRIQDAIESEIERIEMEYDERRGMSVVDGLKREVESLESKLADAQSKLSNALKAEYPFKVGDIVEVYDNGRRNGIGKVIAVKINYSDEAEAVIAPKTKTGFHPRRTIWLGYGSKIRKVV